MKTQLTEGNVLKNLVRFSLPFLLSYFLQTLYGLADLFIAGQFHGAEVITAVSVGSQIMHMITVIIVGLAMGPAVLIGHAVGENNKNRIRTIIFTSIVLFALVSVVFTVLLLALCPQIVGIVSTPAESVEQTRLYLFICFAGIPFITAYNVIASVFRGLGDSKSPMIYIAIACFFNIVLDFIFMGNLQMGAEGAALATVIAQAASVIISLFAAILKREKSPSEKEKLKFSSKEAKEIFKIGIPVACQDGFIQISFLLITVIANKRGVNVAAAVGIVEKIISFLFLVPSSLLSSISAIASQNIGAKKINRAEKTLSYGIKIGFCAGLVFAVLSQFFAENVISMFTSNAEVVRFGCQYIKTYVFDCVFAAIHFCFSGYFCACGKSIYAFLHNAISIIFVRIPGAYLASVMFTETLLPMGLAATCGSILSSIICAIIFSRLHKKNAFI